MPYDKFEVDGEICVYRTVNGQRSGSSLGCHSTESEANDQLAALYASEEKSMNEKQLKAEENNNKANPEWFMGTSFDEFEALEEMEEMAQHVMKGARLVPSIVENLIYQGKMEKSSIQKVGDEFKGFINKIFGEEEEIKSVEKDNSFIVVKDVDTETYMFFSRYSNNIKDRDLPPDIISSESHERFVKMVDEGVYPMPDLWLWHEPSLVIGKTTWVDFDKENGVAMAAGVFYPYANHIAKAIQDSDVRWTVSHGMPPGSIVRDPARPEVMVQHQTIEISPVPFVKAANVWADFETLEKEIDMGMTAEKRAQLKNFLPITDDEIDAIESRNKAISQTAEELKLERKEITEVEETEIQAEVEDVEEVEETEVTPPDTEEKEIGAFTSEQRKELSELLNSAFATLIENLDARYAATKEVEEKPEIEEKEAKFDLMTAVGLQEEVVGNLKSLSAIIAPETKVDGRKVKNLMPKETEADDLNESIVTNDPLLNKVIVGLFNQPAEINGE